MDWMLTIGDFWLTTLAWVAGLAVAFGILARLMPCNAGMYWWQDLRAAGTDFIYWFVVPLFMQVGRLIMLVVGLAFLFGGNEPRFLALKGLPLWQQCGAILLLQDVILYGIHRLFHLPWGWKFHAIHHSPKVLDWVSSTRFHPINNLLAFSLADVIVLLMGFSPAALFVLTPFNIIYSAMVHANLSWTFGPVRYILASPVFHRWHHTTQNQGLDKNFASTFPFLDVIFGTFYMPPGKLPDQFGNGHPDFPEGFWGQFLHPFRKGKPQPFQPGQPNVPAGGALRWARRRPIAAAVLAMTVLAFASLLGGGVYLLARLEDQNEQLGQELTRVKVQQLQAETARQGVRRAAVLRVAISADGRRIVTGSAAGSVTVWSTATNREELTLTGHTGPVYAVAVSADGRHIVSGSLDTTVKLWDAVTGREKRTLRGHTSAVLSVAVSADGLRIVSGSADLTARVWDAATGQEKLKLPLDPGAIPCVAISGDGRHIVSAGSGTAKVWNARTGQSEFTLLMVDAGAVPCVAIGADGRRIVSAGWGTVNVWNAQTGQCKLTLTGHSGPVFGVAISPDGKRIVSGGKDKTVRVWDAATGREEFTLTGPTDFVTSVAVSTEGNYIVSACRDGTMKVWDTRMYQPLPIQKLERTDAARAGSGFSSR